MDQHGPAWTSIVSTTIYEEMNQSNVFSFGHVCRPKSKERKQAIAKVDGVDMFIVISNVK